MAKSTLQLDIVSLESQIFSGRVEMVIVTGEMGEMGILPGHTQLLTSIKPGQIRIVLQDGAQDIYYVSGGMLEIQPYEVSILADTVIHAADLDEAAAMTARENAKNAMLKRDANADISHVMAEIAQATAKLRTINLSRKTKK